MVFLILERKLPNPDGTRYDEFVINKHTIALFHLRLHAASSLDAGIASGERRQKLDVYEPHVSTLSKLNGKGPGVRDWSKELAKCLSKRHPVFRDVVKQRKSHRGEDDCEPRIAGRC
jgi:hypothetical protein